MKPERRRSPAPEIDEHPNLKCGWESGRARRCKFFARHEQPDTQTLYTANQVDNDVSVIDASICDAQTTSGCRHPAPEAAITEAGGVTADPAVGTTYVTTGANAVAMIDTRGCNAFHTAGCAETPPSVTVGTDDHTCNATNQAGCGTVSTLNVPDGTR